MFPNSFINKLKDNVDLVNLVSDYTELKKVNDLLYIGRCPHPEHEDVNPSFRVWKKGYKSNSNINLYDSWACMVCHSGKKDFNNGSDCIAFIQWIENLSFVDAVKFICDKYGIPIPEDKNAHLYTKNKKLAYKFIDDINDKTINYLKNRGLDDNDIFSWGLGYDSFNDKIVFPLLDRYKNVLGFTKRYFVVPEDNNDKYKNSPNSPIFNKGSYLYGIHNMDDNFPEIRITEGSMDVILAQKYGVKNIFGTLGTAFTDSHVLLMKHFNKTPVFCMDGDKAGLKAIKRAIDMLAKEHIYSKILILPNGKDIADMALELKDNLEQYINDNAVTYGYYMISNSLNKFNANFNELKLKYYPKLMKILELVPDKNEKEILKSFIKHNFYLDIK